MFVNRSKNKSGTVSVHVLQKRGRNNVLIKSFGSSKDEKEIERMVAQAKEFIQHQTGTYYHLFNQPAEQGIDDFVDNLSNSQVSIDGSEAIFSRLFDYVGYGEIGGLFRPLVLKITFAHSATVMDGYIDVVFYDITTLYFEAADEDDIRRIGYSKDGKFDCPQVLLGLLVTRDGMPISYEIFEGDLSEKKTFIPLLKRAKQKFGFPFSDSCC